jgi:hypothetical protein
MTETSSLLERMRAVRLWCSHLCSLSFVSQEVLAIDEDLIRTAFGGRLPADSNCVIQHIPRKEVLSLLVERASVGSHPLLQILETLSAYDPMLRIEEDYLQRTTVNVSVLAAVLSD